MTRPATRRPARRIPCGRFSQKPQLPSSISHTLVYVFNVYGRGGRPERRWLGVPPPGGGRCEVVSPVPAGTSFFRVDLFLLGSLSPTRANVEGVV